MVVVGNGMLMCAVIFTIIYWSHKDITMELLCSTKRREKQFVMIAAVVFIVLCYFFTLTHCKPPKKKGGKGEKEMDDTAAIMGVNLVRVMIIYIPCVSI